VPSFFAVFGYLPNSKYYFAQTQCKRLRSMAVGESKDWLEDSDHMPLIMDFEGV